MRLSKWPLEQKTWLAPPYQLLHCISYMLFLYVRAQLKLMSSNATKVVEIQPMVWICIDFVPRINSQHDSFLLSTLCLSACQWNCQKRGISAPSSCAHIQVYAVVYHKAAFGDVTKGTATSPMSLTTSLQQIMDSTFYYSHILLGFISLSSSKTAKEPIKDWRL